MNVNHFIPKGDAIPPNPSEVAEAKQMKDAENPLASFGWSKEEQPPFENMPEST